MAARGSRLEAIRALTIDSVTVEVVCAMRDAGIRPLLIKGVVVARWLYGASEIRPYGDADLIVDPAQFEGAEAVLARLGFHALTASFDDAERDRHEADAHTWVRSADRYEMVDLHRSWPLIPLTPADAWSLLSRDPDEIMLGATSIEVPSRPVHLMILALHALKHGPSFPKPLADLTHAIAVVDDHTWQLGAVCAQQLGAAGLMREGLQLVGGGRELADRLGLPDDAPRSAQLLASGAPELSLGIERLLATRGVRARAEVIARELVPSPAFLRRRHSIARRGRIGLALAYLWRPIALAIALPRAAWAWGAIGLRGRAPRL